MSQIRFLFDECIDPDLIDALLRREPSIDAQRVDWPEGPASGTKDPELLNMAETMGRMLISNDRNTLTDYLQRHFTVGRHTHGVALLRRGFSFRAYVENLLILWSASEAEEWTDATLYLPM